MIQNSREQILKDILGASSKDFTCVKVEVITIDDQASYPLNPPSNKEIYYAIIQPTVDGGAATAQALINVSESKDYPATASPSLGHVLGLYDIYDIKGNNNINAFTMTAIDNGVNHGITVSYYSL